MYLFLRSKLSSAGSNMKHKFSLLPQTDTGDNLHHTEESVYLRKRKHFPTGFLTSFVLLNALFWLYFNVRWGENYVPTDFGIENSCLLSDVTNTSTAQVNHLETVWTRFWWHTKYSPMNHNESDHLYEAILPQHGFIAIDREEAAQKHWPTSMYLPSDHTKGVYLLEAYHQLHCLVSIPIPCVSMVHG